MSRSIMPHCYEEGAEGVGIGADEEEDEEDEAADDDEAAGGGEATGEAVSLF